MAIGRLSVKVGKSGKAGPHAAYVAREGRYANRPEKGERLDATGTGNLPAWAQANPLAFWQAADLHERANGTTYREFEAALPRELTAADRLALVRGFIGQELGDRHAYQFAIHCPVAADGQDQPHAHVMFSERQRDGIERDPAQYFKRHNAKNPERGGAKKGWGEHAGQTRSKDERAADLKALRGRWETACNAALERAGHAERIDMRSHRERGLALPPERKLLPSEWRTPGRKADVIEFRKARAELSKAVPDIATEIVNLDERRKERDRRPNAEDMEKGQADARRAYEQHKAERPKGMERTGSAVNSSRFRAKAKPEPPPAKPPRPGSIAAIAADLGKIDRGAPIEQQAKAFDRIQNTLAEASKARLDRVAPKATARRDRRTQAARKLWEAKPQPPTGLLAGFKRQGYEDALGQWQKDRQRAERLKTQAEKTRDKIVYETLYDSFPKDWAKRVIERAEPDLTCRVDAYKATEREKREEERKKKELEREFKGMAARRAMKAHGYTDSSRQWQATPELLREIIDDYNSRPKEQRERGLAARMRDPEQSEAIAAMIEQHREYSRDQGMSR